MNCEVCGDTIPRRRSNQTTCKERCRSVLRRETFRQLWTDSDPQSAPGLKRCPSCGDKKERTQFFVNRTSYDGLQGHCKPCKVARQRSHTAAGKYRIESWEHFLAQRGGKCEICHRETTLCVDHDHSCCTGKMTCGECVRGLLCGSCNRAIGLMADQPSRLRAAADYLEASVA